MSQEMYGTWMRRALPDKSLSERGKRCHGGKNSKERATWAFFVSASGEKEAPIVVGKSRNPHCFIKGQFTSL